MADVNGFQTGYAKLYEMYREGGTNLDAIKLREKANINFFENTATTPKWAAGGAIVGLGVGALLGGGLAKIGTAAVGTLVGASLGLQVDEHFAGNDAKIENKNLYRNPKYCTSAEDAARVCSEADNKTLPVYNGED